MAVGEKVRPGTLSGKGNAGERDEGVLFSVLATFQ